MTIPQLKRKLRQLKQTECRIRFRTRPRKDHQTLVWDAFFSTRSGDDDRVVYTLNRLANMNHEEIKKVYEAFFYRVYFQYFKEHGLSMADAYDPGLLSLLGLPPYATLHDIKRRYRELAQVHHPDHGGDHDAFIEVVDAYERLTDTGRT
ncbi:MAG: DnaJ domain-containing protein [Gemmatimonadetes bacterium]|nr:DnaJ domain-containing protein [Gemmatimonadota bacterium]